MTADPAIGIVTCVRNEERFLETYLRYHRRIGVSRAYVFLDRCSDRSEEIARSFRWVRTVVLPETVGSANAYISGLHKHVCQVALEQARSDGLDWLGILDPDEFAYGLDVSARPGRLQPQRGSAAQGDLRRLCASVSPQAEMIVLKTREAVPFALAPEQPFWAQRFFQSRFPVRRRIQDPLDPGRRQWTAWLGDNVGKSLVRVAAPLRPRGSHFWFVERDGELQEPHTTRCGSYYHFHLTGAAHWREKFAKLAHEPDVWPSGDPVPFTKQVWKRASAQLSKKQARQYLERHVFRSEKELMFRAFLGQVTQETVIADVIGED